MPDKIAGHSDSLSGKNLKSMPGVARSNFVLKKGLILMLTASKGLNFFILSFEEIEKILVRTAQLLNCNPLPDPMMVNSSVDFIYSSGMHFLEDSLCLSKFS